jgi:SAM-dependent methyltransferase
MRHFDDSEGFLRYAHARFTGTTPTIFDQPVDPVAGSMTSYDRLIGALDADESALDVLDLGCGDGVLCEKLLSTRLDLARLCGLDVSQAEVAAAHRRLAGRPVELFEARAQSMPFADASFDAVLSHMVLMLLDPLDDAVREIVRILRPGGLFAAIVNTGGMSGPALSVYRAHYEGIAEHHREASFHRLGDPRAREREGLEALLSPGNGFASCAFEFFDLALRLPPAGVSRMFLNAYDAYCLDDAGLRKLDEALTRDCATLAESDGLLPLAIGLCRVVGRRQ